MLMNEKKSEFNVLMPGKSTEAGTNRRTALQAALGIRYTATALPILTQSAIKTCSERLTAGETTEEFSV